MLPNKEQALAIIGEIKPWWSKEDGMFLYEHPKFPRFVAGGDTEQEVKDSYLRALEELNNPDGLSDELKSAIRGF